MYRVLLLEDDTHLQRVLSDSFPNSIYTVTSVSTLSEAYSHVDTEQFDIVISDRVVPDGDGIDLIAHVRELYPTTRSILLTHVSEQHEVLSGLSHGADDYLTKPFSLLELKLRVRNLISLHRAQQDKAVSAGQFRLNVDTGILHNTASNTLTSFRKKETQLLLSLLKNKNAVVSRKRLVDDVWRQHSHTPARSTLDVYMRRIRSKLKNDSHRLVTHRGFGYQFLCDRDL